MPLLFPASPSSRSAAASNTAFSPAWKENGKRSAEEVEAFKVKLNSALHDHREYTDLPVGESSPGLEAALNVLLGLATEGPSRTMAASVAAREVLAAALYARDSTIARLAISLVPSILGNGDLKTGVPAELDVVGRLIELLKTAPDLKAQDTCCAALASIANAVAFEDTTEAERVAEEARFSIRQRILQSNGLAVLLPILARKKQSEKQRYLNAWDLESCQAQAANVLTALFEAWDDVGSPEAADVILKSHVIPRLVELTRSYHVEGDAQRASLRCLVALCAADPRARALSRQHGAESDAKWVLTHPAGSGPAARESQRLAGALIALLKDGRAGNAPSQMSPPRVVDNPKRSFGSASSLESLDLESETVDNDEAASPSSRPLTELSVKELKDLLSGAGISCKGCVERADLIALASKYGLVSAPSSPSASVRETGAKNPGRSKSPAGSVKEAGAKRSGGRSVAGAQPEGLSEDIAGNVGDCLAALIQSLLRDGDAQADAVAMGALGRLSKLGMMLRDGSATPMAAAFAVPMTTSSLSSAIRDCALAQLLRHAAPEAREAAAHSGLLQAACLALRSEDECAWAPATEMLAVFTEDPSLGYLVNEHGAVPPAIRSLLTFDRDAARSGSISPLVASSVKLLANLLEENRDEFSGEDAGAERVKRQRIAALIVKQDCLPIVLEVLATAAGDKVPKGSPQRSVAADAMRLLHSLQKQEALRTKVTSLLETGLGQILAGFVESRAPATAEAAAACRLLADLAPVPGFCEGFGDELPELVGRIASRIEKDGTKEEKGGSDSTLVSPARRALVRLVRHLKPLKLDFWASEFTWRAVCATVAESPSDTCQEAVAAAEHLIAHKMVTIDQLSKTFWPALIQRISAAAARPDEAALLNKLLLFVAKSLSPGHAGPEPRAEPETKGTKANGTIAETGHKLRLTSGSVGGGGSEKSLVLGTPVERKNGRNDGGRIPLEGNGSHLLLEGGAYDGSDEEDEASSTSEIAVYFGGDLSPYSASERSPTSGGELSPYSYQDGRTASSSSDRALFAPQKMARVVNSKALAEPEPKESIPTKKAESERSAAESAKGNGIPAVLGTTERDGMAGDGESVLGGFVRARASWKLSKDERERLMIGLLSAGLSAAVVPLFATPAALPALSVVGSLGADLKGMDKVTGLLLRDKLLIPVLARLVTLAEAEQEVLLLARLALKQLYFANPLCAETGDHPGQARLGVSTKPGAPPDYFAYSHHSGCIVVAPEMGDRAMAALREVVAAKRVEGTSLSPKKQLTRPPGASSGGNCGWCGAEIAVCVRCTHCHVGPKYCSDVCRHSAWPTHKEDCPKCVK
ncbi:hypothetical protein KFL_000400410 [Klebsormidium nitens]|uniref:MYND-type domain-containing protein n=1 Tax=Klebsormidium nitens TaxID=105231 RepID=A0A1Y1HTN2_KLENI|nr:hypothetical protein KFL_000400410 [Klebsormidium nitens]|eukprot:GAQ79897.1 hypothetical protein KFL_000400410 [Klebsormidium nitens]